MNLQMLTIFTHNGQKRKDENFSNFTKNVSSLKILAEICTRSYMILIYDVCVIFNVSILQNFENWLKATILKAKMALLMIFSCKIGTKS